MGDELKVIGSELLELLTDEARTTAAKQVTLKEENNRLQLEAHKHRQEKLDEVNLTSAFQSATEELKQQRKELCEKDTAEKELQEKVATLEQRLLAVQAELNATNLKSEAVGAAKESVEQVSHQHKR
jgi:hypothetical protein